VGGAGGPAFKLQKPHRCGCLVLRVGEKGGYDDGITTGGVERTRVAPAASPPTPSASSGQALAKDARMGHPPHHEVILRTYLKAGSPDSPSVIASGSSEMTCSAIFRDATLSAPTIASI
jgi:hypothetical protein